MSYLERVRTLQSWDPAAYRPFTAGGKKVGLIHRDFIPHLADFGAVLQVSKTEVTLAPDLGDPASRTAAMAGRSPFQRRLARAAWARPRSAASVVGSGNPASSTANRSRMAAI